MRTLIIFMLCLNFLFSCKQNTQNNTAPQTDAASSVSRDTFSESSENEEDTLSFEEARKRILAYSDKDKALDLSGLQDSIPKELFALKSLEILNLSYSNIKALPPEFGNLVNLKKLIFKFCVMPEIPKTANKLRNIHTLNYFASLGELPESLGNLKYLRRIEIAKGEITKFPNSIGELTYLEEIDCVKEYGLSEIPESFGKLKSLNYFRGGLNSIQKLPESFGNLQNLRLLQIDVSRLPQSFAQLHLDSLVFTSRGDFELPENFGDIHAKFIEIQSTNLTTLPESFGNIQGLRELRINKNQLKQLPESFGQLTNLEILDLGNNQLSSLPNSFSQLINLKQLDLQINKFKVFPNVLYKLKNLTTLNLRNNNINQLGDELLELVNLNCLNFSNNNFTKLPSQIPNMGKLEFCTFQNNLISNLSSKYNKDGEEGCILNYPEAIYR